MNVQVRQRKLSDDQVRSIREDGRSLSQLARVYDVSEKTIYLVKKGKRKAGVPDIAPAAHIAAPSKDEQP